jgi:hypothetical protein
LNRFGVNTIPEGTPFSELEKVLVPTYMMHRYQVEAVAKLIGGLNYAYTVKGDNLDPVINPVSSVEQMKAAGALLLSLSPEHLILPESLVNLIPPSAAGYYRSRETFDGRTNVVFDPLAPAEAHISLVLDLLLDQDRMARIHRFHSSGSISFSLEEFLDRISDELFVSSEIQGSHLVLHELVQKLYWAKLLRATMSTSADPFVTSAILAQIRRIKDLYIADGRNMSKSHRIYLEHLFAMSEKNSLNEVLPKSKLLPPGAPIGCEHQDFLR